MKIFAIYTTVKITNKPNWLDGFRSIYDLEYNPRTKQYEKPYEMHVTLVQPRYISSADSLKLKKRLEALFDKSNIGKLDIDFSAWHLDRQDATNKGCVMIKSTEHDKLSDLQKRLLDTIGNNHDYLDPSCEAYENDFIPHLTIGRNLSRERFDNAISELPKNVRISATINSIVLSVVNNITTDECTNPKNLYVFNL